MARRRACARLWAPSSHFWFCYISPLCIRKGTYSVYLGKSFEMSRFSLQRRTANTCKFIFLACHERKIVYMQSGALRGSSSALSTPIFQVNTKHLLESSLRDLTKFACFSTAQASTFQKNVQNVLILLLIILFTKSANLPSLCPI